MLDAKGKIPMNGAGDPVDLHMASRRSQPSPVFLPFIPQRIKLGCKDQAIRKTGKILRQQRGEIRIGPIRLCSLIKLQIIFHLLAGEKISLPIFRHRFIR